MNPRHLALQQLLADDDPETVRLVKEQLLNGGPEGVPELRELLKCDQENVSRHVRQILQEIQNRTADRALLDHLRSFSDESGLEEACWLLAEAMLPGIRTAHYRKTLDAWGEQLRRRLSGDGSAADRIGALRELFCDELGFHGNAQDYYNPSNSLLPSVIDTRLGIPISLSVLFAFVSARAGILVHGINLPGHFIAEHGGIFFDPFHEARLISQEDCAAILARQHVRMDAAALVPVGGRSIFLRMLANLLYVFEKREDPAQTERISRWIRILDPLDPD